MAALSPSGRSLAHGRLGAAGHVIAALRSAAVVGWTFRLLHSVSLMRLWLGHILGSRVVAKPYPRAVQSERSVVAAEPECAQSRRDLFAARVLRYPMCSANPGWPEF